MQVGGVNDVSAFVCPVVGAVSQWPMGYAALSVAGNHGTGVTDCPCIVVGCSVASIIGGLRLVLGRDAMGST